MVTINLLDWRIKKVQVSNHRFVFILCVAAIISASITMTGNIFLNGLIDTLKGDITFLDGELQGVEGKIKEIKDLQQQKDLLLSRRKIIEDLQASRSLAVKIFDNIARAMPDGIYLTELTRKEDSLSLVGKSSSNYSITVLMQNIQKIDWVKDAKLGEIKMAEANPDIANAPGQIDFSLAITINTQGMTTSNANDSGGSK